MKDVSIVLPCYKSDESLQIITEQINEIVSEYKYDLELILVNDSPHYHQTTKRIKELEIKYHFVKGVFLRKNQGQHMALIVGLSKVQGEYVITMDDDLQHPVNEIPSLLNEMVLHKNIDAIFAIPKYSNKKHSLLRNLGSFFLNKIDTYFLNKPKGLVKSSFKIFTKDIAEIVLLNRNSTPSLSSLIIDNTSNIKNYTVNHNKREFGISNYNLSKLINLTLNNLIHYSSLPLKVVGIIGFLGFIFSIIFIMVILTQKLIFGLSFPGYASTVTLISFFGGLNLLALGIIGEYLIRIIKEQQKKDLESLIK